MADEIAALRELMNERAMWQERLRLAEKAALERALQIKEDGDRQALDLARTIQTYKDEQANRLREQISSERGLYATKDDLQAAVREVTTRIEPMINYITLSQGSTSGKQDLRALIFGTAAFLATVVGLGVTVIAVVN